MLGEHLGEDRKLSRRLLMVEWPRARWREGIWNPKITIVFTTAFFNSPHGMFVVGTFIISMLEQAFQR